MNNFLIKLVTCDAVLSAMSTATWPKFPLKIPIDAKNFTEFVYIITIHKILKFKIGLDLWLLQQLYLAMNNAHFPPDHIY